MKVTLHQEDRVIDESDMIHTTGNGATLEAIELEGQIKSVEELKELIQYLNGHIINLVGIPNYERRN